MWTVAAAFTVERVFPVEQLTSGLSRVEIVYIGRLANMVSRAQGAFLGYHPMIYYEAEGERNEALRHHC